MEADGIIGKKIIVIFEDGKDHVSKKLGICTLNNTNEIIIDNLHLIPKSRIIRIEVQR